MRLKSSYAPTFNPFFPPLEGSCAEMKSYFASQEKGGIVRKVPNKPAKVGIWHYRGTVMLSNGEPFLVEVHDTASSMGESTQTASIVLEWADLVQKFNQPTVICMDSYYLDNVGRQLLKDRGVRYIAALKPDRFRILTNLLKPQVNNTGDSSWVWNKARGEATVYHKSRDKSIGEKFGLSNCFAMTPNKMRRHEVRIYDEYKAMFSGFNRQPHNRNFPYALPRDTNMAVEKNISVKLVDHRKKGVQRGGDVLY